MKTSTVTRFESQKMLPAIKIGLWYSANKFLLALLFVFLSSYPTAEAQLSLGLKAGYTPNVRPGTAQRILNRDDRSTEFLFNSHLREYTPAFGLIARLDKKPFWFSAEVLGQGWTETYSMKYISDRRLQSASHLREKNYVLEVPLSVGVSLGRIEVFSGLSVLQTLSHKSELSALNSYTSALPERTAGWHTGIGINLNNILIDIRFSQQFNNYGQHRYINGEELTLGNAPHKLLATIAYRF